MPTQDPLSDIKAAEKEAAGIVAAAKQEVEKNIQAAEAEGRDQLAKVEASITPELQRIEEWAVAGLKEKKNQITNETDQTIKNLRSQAEPKQDEAVRAVMEEILS